MDEQRKWFLEMETTPGGDVLKTAERTTKDSEYYINLADETMAGFERTDSNVESSILSKMLPNSMAATEKYVKRQLMWQISLLS